jgi:hypothetical protein
MMMHSMGALTGFAYLELIKYRKASQYEKETSYKTLHFFQQRKWLGNLFCLLSIMAILITYLSAWASNRNAYKVDHALDIIYYGFNRFLLTLACMAVLFNGFMGHFNSLERTFLNDYTRSIARTSYTIGLFTPIVICLFNLS